MERPLTQNIHPDREPLDLRDYERAGGYQALRKAIRTMTPQAITGEVTAANVRGRGGAGFPMGMKWAGVPMDADAPVKYLVVNADEMEPGSFKDRILLEGNPHQMIESMMIAGFAIQASMAYLFLRDEYALAAQRLNQAIAAAYKAGFLGENILGSGYRLDIVVHSSAGRYICGEASALLSALEGGRALPRSRPPRTTTSGLWGKPTLVNNVETLCNVPHIINNGADWFKSLSRAPEGKHGREGGTKLYGVSGKVNKPGAWELPMGTTLREILEDHAGGMRDGLKFRATLPGGASTRFVMPEHLDVQMDFDSMEKIGSRLGTGTLIVLDSGNCPVGMLHNLMHFYAQESCGFCTPCREGLPWIEQLLMALENGASRPDDRAKLDQLCNSIGPAQTFCGLAPGAQEPLQSGLMQFRDDIERHLKERRCPYRGH